MAAQWSYDGEETGPETWAQNFPAGQGKRQSPIDLVIRRAKYDQTLGPLKLDYEQCKAVSIFNSGHSFQVNFDTNSPAILTGGPLKDDQYQLVQFHGHWSDSNKKHGSEHTVNGRSYPAEFHFVHFNKKYGSVAEALQQPDGLSVIGVFLKDNATKPHAQLRQLLGKFNDISDNKTEAPVTGVDVLQFIPTDLTQYFTYLGSLTTPPLNECVTWIIMSEAMAVSKDQIQKFRDLKDLHSGESMVNNFRPVQPLNGRQILASFDEFTMCEIAANAPITD